MLIMFSSDFGVKTPDWTCRLFYNSNCSKPNRLVSLFEKSSVNQRFCKLLNFQQTYLEEAQLIKRFTNYQTSVQYLNHLLELRHDGIKLSLSQKRSTSFSQIKLAWKNISRNNPNTQHRKCFVSSNSFSIFTYPIHPEKPAENYKTLYGLILLWKSLGRATRRPAEGTISRLLLREVIYRMLLLLPTM